MTDFERAFSNGKALIPFLTAGDPDLDTTAQLILTLEKAGADLIEIGLPFSDPVAEGEVIQRASERALASGMTTDDIFDMVAKVRQQSRVPLAFMTYANLVYTYGKKRFLERCRALGVCGLILPDIPFEEKEEMQPECRENGVALISLIAPTSRQRIQRIASQAEGFLYCVSSMGVTGVRSEFSSQLSDMMALVRQSSGIPCAIGFGVSTPEQAAEMSQLSDGVIVGSAIVHLVEQYGHDCLPYVERFARELKQAMGCLQRT